MKRRAVNSWTFRQPAPENAALSATSALPATAAADLDSTSAVNSG
jgi:hypothetical protein